MNALERLEAAQADARPLPHNIEMEQGLIGAILLNNDAYLRVAGIVAAEHFHEEIHQSIWSVMAAQIAKGQVANPITLKTYLGNPEWQPGKTLVAYLTGLASDAPIGRASAESYAKTVRDLYLRREVIAVTERAAAIAYDAPVEATAETIFGDIERDIEKLRPSVQKDDDGFRDFDEIGLDDIYDAYQNKRGIVGLSTGLPRADAVMNGLQPSDLIILAGRPAMGKTALATGMGVSVARGLREQGAGGVVGFFSLEMSAAQLKHRIVSDMASVQASKLAKGEADEEEMQRFVDADRELRGLPLKIDKTGGLSIAQVKMRARALHKRHGLRLLIIDYLQLLSGTPNRSRDQNRTQEVTEITTGLKALAKELNIPIVALSQLSRKVEERDDKRPMLQDLRESGSIEQDADMVLFVYRDEYYERQRKPREDGERLAEWARKMDRIRGVAELNVAKNRHGPAEVVELGWLGEFTRFTNEPPWRSPDPEEARKKRVKLTSHGEALREILRELATVVGSRPTSADLEKKPGLPPNAMLIPRNEVKTLFFERVVADLPPSEAGKRLQAAADNLRNNKLTESLSNAEGVKVVYLVELIAE